MSLSETDNMEWRDATLSMERANALSLALMAVVILAAGIPYVGIWGLEALVAALDQVTGWLLLLPLLIGGIVAHDSLPDTTGGVTSG